MIALQVLAALLLAAGSGLIILALIKVDRDEDMGRVSPGHWSRRDGR